jgi:RHS repeat-associated protein
MTLSGTTNYFYYQTDHLGSTGYLTDKNGTLKEHIEYTPWGESWFSNPGTPVLDYKFTGKEQDNTGFYYFGARYYDPQTSLWISVDPILGTYLEAVGKGQANSMNFALYAYGGQNPVRMIDPDGNASYGAPTIGDVMYMATAPLDYLQGILGFHQDTPEEAAEQEQKQRQFKQVVSNCIEAYAMIKGGNEAIENGENGAINKAITKGIATTAAAGGLAENATEAITHKEVNPVLKFFTSILGFVFGGIGKPTDVVEGLAVAKNGVEAYKIAPKAVNQVVPNPNTQNSDECK